MSTYVVCMDHNHAKIFKLANEQTESVTVKCDNGGHQSSADPKHRKNQDKFFHALIKELNEASEILILGSGLAKTEFYHHLKEHHHESLAKKVVGVGTVDHISDNMVLAEARKFFKKFDLYGGKAGAEI